MSVWWPVMDLPYPGCIPTQCRIGIHLNPDQNKVAT